MKKALPRIVGTLEDLQYVHEYENYEKSTKNKPPSNIVTPTRDIRANKRRVNIVQAEEAKKRHALKMTP